MRRGWSLIPGKKDHKFGQDHQFHEKERTGRGRGDNADPSMNSGSLGPTKRRFQRKSCELGRKKSSPLWAKFVNNIAPKKEIRLCLRCRIRAESILSGAVGRLRVPQALLLPLRGRNSRRTSTQNGRSLTHIGKKENREANSPTIEMKKRTSGKRATK